MTIWLVWITFYIYPNVIMSVIEILVVALLYYFTNRISKPKYVT